MKVLAFSEAYIFVLEASKSSLLNLHSIRALSESGEELEPSAETIHASYVRLNTYLKQHGMEIGEYFRSILFVDLIASTEFFFADLIKAVLSHYPQKIGKIQFELKDILRAASPTELVEQAADEYVNKLMYEKPEDYLEKLCLTLSIDSEPIQPFWPSYIEAKARRDLGAHSAWKCNKTYLRKVAAVGGNVNANEGEIMTPKDEVYCSGISGNIFRICETMSQLVCEKFKGTSNGNITTQGA